MSAPRAALLFSLVAAVSVVVAACAPAEEPPIHEGAPCTTDAECGGGRCKDNACTAAEGECSGDFCTEPGPSPDAGPSCGGSAGPPCPAGEACAEDSDCADQRCVANRCAEPTATDGVKNGTETDIDCGGGAPTNAPRCAEGLACLVDGDCNGACNYENKCVDVKSCKRRFGGDTCGTEPLYPGEPGDTSNEATRESCCRSLPVPGYEDPSQPGKQVFLDKYEITAGRVRAFIEAIAEGNGGVPDVKAWVSANKPPIWDDAWDVLLPSGTNAASIQTPRSPNQSGNATESRNVGTDFLFGSELYIYVHGHNCGNLPGSYGYPTFFYPDAVLTARGEVPRAQGLDGDGAAIPAEEVLDAKAMTCIPSAMLAAFCHWDGGQLATNEVLDFVTNTPKNLGNGAGCGSRCAPLASVQATSDSGAGGGYRYFFPFYPDDAKHEGVSRIAPPGRVHTDVVRIGPDDEPWMDLHGNVQEVVLDMNGATFTGKFGLKYRGVGYSSARAAGNLSKLPHPEYKAGYSGGRCMRFE